MPSSLVPIKESPVGQINTLDHFSFVGGREQFMGRLLGASELTKSIASVSSSAAQKLVVLETADKIFSALQQKTFEDMSKKFSRDTEDITPNVPMSYKDMLKECNKDVGYIIWIKGDTLVSFPEIT